MVRPESCIIPTGGSPVRVSAGAPGGRHQYTEEISYAKRCVESLEVGGSEGAGSNCQMLCMRGHQAASLSASGS